MKILSEKHFAELLERRYQEGHRQGYTLALSARDYHVKISEKEEFLRDLRTQFLDNPSPEVGKMLRYLEAKR